MKRKLTISMLMMFFCLILTANLLGDQNKKILVTTFPIYQITRNITNNAKNIKLQLMLPSQLGCPHDYALRPQDMSKLAKSDILIINGLGMEEFIGAPVKKANVNIKVIDSSAGVTDLLEYTEEDHGDHDGHKDHEGGSAHHHHHEGINPHLFASPKMRAKIALSIANQLGKTDPARAELYQKNAKAYAAKMDKLADKMAALGKKLKNNRIVQPHGVFDYLARDMGLKIIAVMQAHGMEPSAAEMMRIVRIIKKKKVGGIFTEPQYPEKVGKTLARETGIPVAKLDPVASGPDNAPLDYFETSMRHNMKILANALGVKD